MSTSTAENPEGLRSSQHAKGASSHSRIRLSLWLLVTSVLARFCVPSPACGPFFPNQMLIDPGAAVLWAPVADLRHEIDRIAPPGSDPIRAILPDADLDPGNRESWREANPHSQSRRVDIAELRETLTQEKVADRDRILEDYERIRGRLEEFTIDQAEWKRQPGEKARPVPQFSALKIPNGLPPEFSDYLRGVIHFDGDRADAARADWATLLARPANARRHRTVWATFMTGKSFLDSNQSAEAIEWFGKTRELAKQGFADKLGLAAASFGWEAKAQWSEGHVVAAIALYLRQNATGDPTAVRSMAIICEELFGDPKGLAQLRTLATGPLGARVVTAFVLAHGGPFRKPPDAAKTTAWLEAVEAGGAGDLVGADRLAWAAYQSGEMTAAHRWLNRAPADTPLALWVKAKLLLRDGQLDQAAATLARAVRAFPADERWDVDEGGYYPSSSENDGSMRPADRAAAELGTLQLSRGQYVQSLDLLMRSGWWLDAAYVAERVVTPDELRKYADQNWPERSRNPQPTAPVARTSAGDMDPVHVGTELRYLLARRLTRIGRWKDAGSYYPAAMRPKLDAYIAAIRNGHDAKRSDADRAAWLWQAATIARHDGMELLGTEGSPDDFVDGGEFEANDVATIRSKLAAGGRLTATEEELERVRSSVAAPNRRFHYRYIALEHAWSAAALMPDESDETARVLNTAGLWLGKRDPAAARRFYESLITRCGATPLGRAARKREWFVLHPGSPDSQPTTDPS